MHDGPSVALLRGLPVVIDVEGAETEELQAPSAPDAPDDEEKEGGQEEALERPTDPKDNEASSLDLSTKVKDISRMLPIVMLVFVLEDAAQHDASKILRRCLVLSVWTISTLVSYESY